MSCACDCVDEMSGSIGVVNSLEYSNKLRLWDPCTLILAPYTCTSIKHFFVVEYKIV